MARLRLESSAESAARFLASRGSRKSAAAERSRVQRQRQREQEERRRLRALSRGPAARPEPLLPRRIVLDLAEPTLRLIHDVLLDAMHAGVPFGDRGALLLIAEQMVAIALGEPPCDDPPLSDREVRR